MESELSRFQQWLRTSISMRLAVIGFLVLVLLIPVALVTDLIDERYQRQQEAVREVGDKWARAQTLTGPFVSVPFVEVQRVWDRERNTYVDQPITRHTHVLPEELRVDGRLVPELRYRGAYEVIVYRAELTLRGSFSRRALTQAMATRRHDLGQARLVLGISDLRGIQSAAQITADGTSAAFDPGLPTTDLTATGISLSLGSLPALEAALRAGGERSSQETTRGSGMAGATRLAGRGEPAGAGGRTLGGGAPDDRVAFSIPLALNGSERLAIAPLGTESDVRLASPWPTPSFDGQFLPDERTVGPDGFTAHWNVLHVNRPFPQVFTGGRDDVEGSAFGVSLLVPVDQYQSTTRAAKYAVLFIGLTFLIWFFAQTLLKVRVHPVQYLLVGVALCVFYTLLIAIAEHLGFTPAYAIGSLAVSAMIGLYSRSVFPRTRTAALVGGLVAALYAFMYAVIQLESYALLAGSIGLFVVLAVVMWLSRRLSWYGAEPS